MEAVERENRAKATEPYRAGIFDTNAAARARRAFIAALGGVAAWPLMARAQHARSHAASNLRSNFKGENTWFDSSTTTSRPARCSIGRAARLHFMGSSCSQKFRIFLNLKGIKWESHLVDLFTNENFLPWFLGMNPRRLVPVLVHDGAVHIEK